MISLLNLKLPKINIGVSFAVNGDMMCDKHSMAFIRGQSPRYLSELQIKLLYIILNATGESKLLKSRTMFQVINLMEFRKCIK